MNKFDFMQDMLTRARSRHEAAQPVSAAPGPSSAPDEPAEAPEQPVTGFNGRAHSPLPLGDE